mgnify:CR=1 FL=1
MTKQKEIVDYRLTEDGWFAYEYQRPALTADSVIFGFDGQYLNVLLVKRGIEPFKGKWALPGGFLRMNETISQCAQRELTEETNFKEVYMEQFGVFSDVNRDPRGRVITSADKSRLDSDYFYFYTHGMDAWRFIVNSDYSQPFYPAKIHPRSETVDFQRGEVEWRGENLYFGRWNYDLELEVL